MSNLFQLDPLQKISLGSDGATTLRETLRQFLDTNSKTSPYVNAASLLLQKTKQADQTCDLNKDEIEMVCHIIKDHLRALQTMEPFEAFEKKERQRDALIKLKSVISRTTKPNNT